jgi:excisionase family DNA binding protein
MTTIEMITTGEAARMLRVSPETVRRWIKRGYIHATQMPSGQSRINKQAIVAIQNQLKDQTK